MKNKADTNFGFREGLAVMGCLVGLAISPILISGILIHEGGKRAYNRLTGKEKKDRNYQDPVALLFKARDPEHEYYSRELEPFLRWSIYDSFIGIYRKGGFWGERVAKISHFDLGRASEIVVYGKQPVRKKEIEELERRNLQESLAKLSLRLEKELESGATEEAAEGRFSNIDKGLEKAGRAPLG